MMVRTHLCIRGQHKASRSLSSDSSSDVSVTTSSIATSSSSGSFRGQTIIPGVPPDLDFLHVQNINSYRPVGTPNNTAQVTPYEFTTAMADLAVEKGATVILGHVTSINKDNAQVTSVTLTSTDDKDRGTSDTLPATDVIICAGPWTSDIYPAAPIVALRQSSVVFTTNRPLSAHMLFAEVSLASDGTRRSRYVTPEIFTRPNNTAWAAGDAESDVTLPLSSDTVTVDLEACESIISNVSAISSELAASSVITRQTCYLPNVAGNVPGPLLGPTEVKGLWIAAGHSCWGIQNSPATGKVMAEFVFEGAAKCADVSELGMEHLQEPDIDMDDVV